MHAAARGLPPPAPARAGDPAAAATAATPRAVGAVFLLEMMFTGPGFDGLGAVFAEGKGDEEKSEKGKEEGAFSPCEHACEA